MGRYGTDPAAVNDLRSFDIKFLSRFDYLKPHSFKGGSIIWTSSNGNKNSIGITVKTNLIDGYLILNYTHAETNDINYQIQLITRPSNLGAGLLWFFVCPFTNKVCRKLHLINGYFKHRTADPRLMYSKQLESKKWREWTNVFGSEFNDDLYQELYGKYFKPFYNGKITKRHARILKKIEKLESKDSQSLWEVMKF